MEPQWNPMAEEQALDRVYRLGQTREVLAIRYITKDSIEEVSTLSCRILMCGFCLLC
jgi:SWI/SNF-related matrix-associated actin-dependent regulator of chromatin subfamily A3